MRRAHVICLGALASLKSGRVAKASAFEGDEMRSRNVVVLSPSTRFVSQLPTAGEMGHHPYENFVFEGGGVKGIGFVGALEEFEKIYGSGSLSQIKRVAGSSAGALTALLLALNVSTPEIKVILSQVIFSELKDDDWGIIRDAQRLRSQFGFYKGDTLLQLCKKLIADKLKGNGDITFAQFEELRKSRPELGLKQLYVTGTNLNTRLGEVFSWANPASQQMKIADAVRISMSLPLFYVPPRFKKNQQGQLTSHVAGDVYVDGGVIRNYPLTLFDQNGSRNPKTLGFRLDSKDEILAFRNGIPKNMPINDLSDCVGALLSTVFNLQEADFMERKDGERTVYIDTGNVKTTDFNLSDVAKQQLIDAGKQAVRDFTRDAAKISPRL